MTALLARAPASAELDQSYRPVFPSAAAIIACLVGAGVGWGMYARLDSAIVTHGIVLAESQRKTVEHLEGGILRRLLVAPGDRVAEGQIVAVLDGTQIEEQLAQLAPSSAPSPTRSGGSPRRSRSAASSIRQPRPGRRSRRARQDRGREALFDARPRAHRGQLGALHAPDRPIARADRGERRPGPRRRAPARDLGRGAGA